MRRSNLEDFCPTSCVAASTNYYRTVVVSSLLSQLEQRSYHPRRRRSDCSTALPVVATSAMACLDAMQIGTRRRLQRRRVLSLVDASLVPVGAAAVAGGPVVAVVVPPVPDLSSSAGVLHVDLVENVRQHIVRGMGQYVGIVVVGVVCQQRDVVGVPFGPEAEVDGAIRE